MISITFFSFTTIILTHLTYFVCAYNQPGGCAYRLDLPYPTWPHRPADFSDSDTEEDLQEVQTSKSARKTKEAPNSENANPTSRKSRSRSRATAADGGETHDGNGASVQDGGKSNLFLGAAPSTRYTRLK